MLFRTIFFLAVISLCISCEYISGGKKTNVVANDTIVDFSTVDASPAFIECAKLIEDERTNCFRDLIGKKFSDRLKNYNLSSNEAINETVTVVLIISNKGEMELSDVIYSDEIQEKLPNLPDVLDTIVSTMPKLLPATKIGIEVTTQYELPIRIQTKE